MTIYGLSGYLGTAVTLSGCAYGFSRWGILGRGYRLATLWLFGSTLADLASYASARMFQNSQVAGALWTPVSLVLAMECLASFNHDTRSTRVFRLMGLIYIAIWVFIAIRVEELDHYSTYSIPLAGLLVLAASTMTIVRRISVGRGDLLTDPGFLAAAAFAAVGIMETFLTPLAQVWSGDKDNLSLGYYVANNSICAMAAMVLIRMLYLRSRTTPMAQVA